MTLKFIVCGLEHTGTTLVSELFRQVPTLDSGFECGVLMNDTPANFLDFKPYSTNMLEGWGITQEQFQFCCQQSSFASFYEKLLTFSTKLAENTTELFDKTPRYLVELDQVLRRGKVPAIITYKDPRAIVCSDYKRSNAQNFDAWFDEYLEPKHLYMQDAYNQYISHTQDRRIISIGLEALAMNARSTMEEMFSHVDKKFKLEYAVISDIKYDNVRGNVVSADIVFEFRRIFTQKQLIKIEKEFSYFDLWFYK